jgi:hypothetical protein
VPATTEKPAGKSADADAKSGKRKAPGKKKSGK